jgi:hypothetical protein
MTEILGSLSSIKRDQLFFFLLEKENNLFHEEMQKIIKSKGWKNL